MRLCLVLIYALACSQLLSAEPTGYRVAVLADTDKTEGGALATLIVEEMRRLERVSIVRDSPDFTVSCFVITLDSARADGARFVASVAVTHADGRLSRHFPAAAETLEALARKVTADVYSRVLEVFRRQDRPQ